MFDKKTVLAFILIAIIFIAWQYYWMETSPPPESIEPAATDTLAQAPTPAQTQETQSAVQEELTPDTSTVVTADTIPEQLVKIETNRYWLTLTNKGGGILTMQLKEYTYADSGHVYLIPADNERATPTLISKSTVFSDSNLTYQTDARDMVLTRDGDARNIQFTGVLPGGSEISKEFTFYSDSLHFDLQVTIDDVESSGLIKEYVLAWLPAIPPTEANLQLDYSNYKGGAFISGDMYKYDSFDDGKLLEDHSGNAEWVGTRSRYFGYAMIPREILSSGAYIFGSKRKIPSPDGEVEERRISSGVVMPLAGPNSVDNRFTIYAGPLDYQILKDYNVNLEDFIDWGWKIIYPFSYAVYWVVYMLHKVISNYGIVIMLVAVLLKVFTYPLTIKQLKSMRAMQALQPKMEELKAKYKDNPQKMNQAVMKLYKEEGVNPFGSCLYMLPQMPFLFGLYQVFRSTFEFRQAYFCSIWPDLSQPDVFPYIMPIIMCVAMFFQQKLSMTDPKYKAMTYLMPIMFFFLFKGLPVGLVLYWTFFSLLSVVETLTIKKPQRLANPEVK